MKRMLSLRRETLAELGSDELAAVVGGQQISAPQATCPVKNCVALTNQFTCLVCFSEPCQTEPNCT